MAETPIARALAEDEYVRARRILMRRDPNLAALMKRVGRCALPDGRTNDPFAGLVRVIMSQQLSGKAADTIFGRVEALAGGRGGLTPASVRALDPVALRGAGVSRPKINYLYDLSDHVADGRLDFPSLDGHPDDEVITRITAVKGLDRWSAEMFLMFRLNRLWHRLLGGQCLSLGDYATGTGPADGATTAGGANVAYRVSICPRRSGTRARSLVGDNRRDRR